jgi:hypothetical protein
MKVFIEEQRLTQSWLVAIVGIALLIPVGVIINKITKEDSTMSSLEIIIFILVISLTIVPIFMFKLKTRIDEKGVYYQFFPLHFKARFIPWAEVENAHVRKYSPISEYGGWGLRGGFIFTSKNGKAVNISGDIGLQLELKTGKRLLIGTQKENEVKQVIASYKI